MNAYLTKNFHFSRFSRYSAKEISEILLRVVFFDLIFNIESAMRMKTSGDGENVKKIWGAGKGFTGFAHMMSHPLNTHR